ncbi:unnamed protein product [Prorocentrum cordatum]|uniref:Uncharacterized protein n=1 Tax=Prorocentrum cordatum TaxID=2364126 RepID=A0ABN9TB51_9DINO|nr:unnamed protein product [Polarella glacialis]
MVPFWAVVLAFMQFEGVGAAAKVASASAGAMVVDHDGRTIGRASAGATALVRRQAADGQLQRSLFVRARWGVVDTNSFVESGSGSLSTRRESARTATVGLHDFIVEEHEAEALAAWQKFYGAQQQEGACPLPASGFDCEQGHECTFKDAELQTFKVLNHGSLTETVFSNGGTAYFFGENSPSVPPYYLAKLQCSGEVLLKAPAAESGDKVDKESCSSYKAVQSVTVGNNTWKSSVERLIRRHGGGSLHRHECVFCERRGLGGGMLA